MTHSKRVVVVVLMAQKKAFFLDSEKESFHPMTMYSKKLFDKNLLKQKNCMKSSPDLFLIFIFPYFFIN